MIIRDFDSYNTKFDIIKSKGYTLGDYNKRIFPLILNSFESLMVFFFIFIFCFYDGVVCSLYIFILIFGIFIEKKVNI